MRGNTARRKADVRRRMKPAHRQSVARIQKAGHSRDHPLANGGRPGGCREEVVTASEKDPKRLWSAGRQVHSGWAWKTAGLNATELSAYCRSGGLLFPRQVDALAPGSPGMQ